MTQYTSVKLPQNIRDHNNLLVFEWECNTLPTELQQKLFLGNIHQDTKSLLLSGMVPCLLYKYTRVEIRASLALDCLIQGLKLGFPTPTVHVLHLQEASWVLVKLWSISRAPAVEVADCFPRAPLELHSHQHFVLYTSGKGGHLNVLVWQRRLLLAFIVLS